MFKGRYKHNFTKRWCLVYLLSEVFCHLVFRFILGLHWRCMSISVHLSSGDILVTEAEEKKIAFQSQTSYKLATLNFMQLLVERHLICLIIIVCSYTAKLQLPHNILTWTSIFNEISLIACNRSWRFWG